MQQEELFNYIYSKVSVSTNYVSRPEGFKTLGGFWTVDAWKIGDITVWLCDEGFSKRIFMFPKLDVWYNPNDGLDFKVGDMKSLVALKNTIDKTTLQGLD